MIGGPLTRRGFLAAAGAAWAAARLDRAASLPSARPLGIQLYTLRDLLARDFEGTLAAVAKIGYREVEFAGLYGRSAKEVRAVLDRAGLVSPAGHVGIPEVTDGIERTISDAKALGQQYVVVPWIPEGARTGDGYRRIAETFNRAADRLHRAGLALGYHNHWFEFDALSGASPECGYDLLLKYTDPGLVVMELDLYWIRKGGRDAMQYFRDFRGRFRLVHVKDMAPDGSMANVGQGVIRWPELLDAAKRAGVRHFLAEHDEPKDPLAFARASLDYLRSLHL